ncbi:unnamed protein product [Cuscuta campestris]|uniref:Replication factor A C-terminal domain-containing protein n=1 Tax=Cuscuta campestris TaxID=132261 RepID=A0A484KZS4_9ASTE|nr:unnamed protein product [Cuscuta campestris]
MFDLKPFRVLQSQPCLNDQVLIDVIGKIVARTKPCPYWIVRKIASMNDSGTGAIWDAPTATKRFKFNVRVYDSTSHASFILWDRECKGILGASAFVLREIMLEKNMDQNFLPIELNRLLGVRGLFHVILKAELGSPYWSGPRAFGVRSLVTDAKIMSRFKEFLECEEEGFDEESEGLWASLEDLSEKVHEVIASNDPSSSQSVNQKHRRIDDLDKTDSVKRELFDDMSTTQCKKSKKDNPSQ